MFAESPFFVYSSFTDPPGDHLAGYCYVDADYVVGDPGRRAYEVATGRRIGDGEDGCYVSITRDGDDVVFGVDSTGMAKLFYYSSGTTWAVSNSLARLAEHLRAQGVSLSPHIHQIAAFGAGTTFTAQMSSFTTVFQEIQLLPSQERLRLSGSQLAREGRRRPSRRSYGDALTRFASLWVSRIGTLLADPRITLTADITGGVDSRTVFALAHAAVSSFGHPTSRMSFRSSNTAHWKKDFPIAKELTDRYGFELNVPATGGNRKPSGRDAFDAWRDVSLGVYLPVYWSRRMADPFTVHMHGGGGENHRHFYPDVKAEKFLDGFASRLPAQYYEPWRTDVLDTIGHLRRAEPAVAPLILHYREFRNRFHTGRAPQYSVVLSPLSSNALNLASSRRRRAPARQIYFDLMESLAPGLMDARYDDSAKAPVKANTKKLTLVDIRGTAYVGRVFASDPPVVDIPSAQDPSAMRLLTNALAEASDAPGVRGHFNPAHLSRITDLMHDALRSNRFHHANEAKEVSHVLTTYLALGKS